MSPTNPQPDPLDEILDLFEGNFGPILQRLDLAPSERLELGRAFHKAAAAIQAHYNARFENSLGPDEGDRRWPNIAEARNKVRGQARARWYSQEGGEKE